MPRGGKRLGAGRKPGHTVDDWTRMAAGEMYHRLYVQALVATARAKLGRKSRRVRELQEQIRAVPVPERRAWWAENGEEHEDAMDRALRKDQGMLNGKDLDLADDTEDINSYIEGDKAFDQEPGRHVVVRIKKLLKGQTAVIEEAVAARFGLSRRMARSCWEEYEQHRRRLRAEEAENGDH